MKFFAFFLFFLASVCEADISVTDNLGRVIDIAQPAKRVISLSPHIAENLYSIGAGELVVGVTRHSDYPPEVLTKPIVGDVYSLNLETIISLQPDLIIAWSEGSSTIGLQRLQEMGVPVYYSAPEQLTDISGELRNFGLLLGLSGAQSIAREFDLRLQDIRSRYSERSEMRVFYQIWDQPLMTINRRQMIDQVIGLCGGRNLFRDHLETVPQLSTESVLAVNPQVIMTGNNASPGWKDRWRRWPELEATRYEQFYELNGDLLYRPTVRMLDAAEQMCSTLAAARQKIDKK